MEREVVTGARYWLNRAIFPVSAGAVGAEIGYVLAAVFSLHSHLGTLAGLLGLIVALGIQLWKRSRGSED